MVERSINDTSGEREQERGSLERARLLISTILGAGTLVAFGSASPALADNECGAPSAGTVTCTSAANPYPSGVTYRPNGSLTLNTTADAQITGPVAVQGPANASTIGFNHAGSVSTAADGLDAVTLTGGDVAVVVSGSIANTGAAIAPTYDADFNQVTPAVPARGIVINAGGAVDFQNNGSITTSGAGSPAVQIIANGDVRIGGTGSVAATYYHSPVMVVTSQNGGVSGTIQNIKTDQNNQQLATVTAAGPVSISVGNGISYSTVPFGFASGTISLTSQQNRVDVTEAGNVGANVRAYAATSASIVLSTGTVVHGGLSVVGQSGATISLGTNTVVEGNVRITNFGGSTNVVVSGTNRVNNSIDGFAAAKSMIVIDQGGYARAVSISGVNYSSLAQGSSIINNGKIGDNDSAYSGSIGLSGGDGTFINNGSLEKAAFGLSGSGNVVQNFGSVVLNGGGGSSSFGDGTRDFLFNNGVISIGTRPLSDLGATTISFAGLSELTNAGSIDLRNNRGGDTLAISGSDMIRASFKGTGRSIVYLDVTNGVRAAIPDVLTVDGAITGSTTVVLNTVGNTPVLFAPVTIVQGGAGTTAGAITVASTGNGAVRYTTVFDAATNSFIVSGGAGDTLVHLARGNEAAQQLWYRSADTVLSHSSEARDARLGGYASGGGRIWGTMYGQLSRRTGSITASAFGNSRDAEAGYRQSTFGAQLGITAVGYSDAHSFTVDVTGGYQSSNVNFARSADRSKLDVANAGVLVGYHHDRAFANLLGQFSYYWIHSRSPDVNYSDRYTGNSYGAQLEAGYRLGDMKLFVEPVLTAAYLRTNLDSSSVTGIAVDFGVFEGLRGKAGARIGTTFDLGDGATVVAYAQGNYVHEFKSDDAATFSERTVSVKIHNHALPDYGEGRIGFSAGRAGGVSGFVEAFGTAGGSYRGGGGRAGIRVPM